MRDELYWSKRGAIIRSAKAHDGNWLKCRHCVFAVANFCIRHSTTEAEKFETVVEFIEAIDGHSALEPLSRSIYSIVRDCE